jgi:hypothetical protein
MADNPYEAPDGGAPLLPGGTPELSGTGPDGAVFAQDGSVVPENHADRPSGQTTTDGEPSPAVNKVADERDEDEA